MRLIVGWVFVCVSCIAHTTYGQGLFVVARAGDDAVAGARFRNTEPTGGLSINAAGQLAFTYEVEATEGLVRGDAVWLRTDEGLTLVAGPEIDGVDRLVAFAPNIPSSLGSQFFLDDDGTIYLMARDDAGADAIHALRTAGSPGMEIVAQEGGAAPGGGVFASLSTFQIQPGGPLHFSATVGGVLGLYLYEGGEVRRVISVGDSIEGDTVEAIRDTGVDARGSVYFKATVRSASESFEGLFVNASDSTVLLAQVEPEAMDAVAAIGSFMVLPRGGVVYEGQRWFDFGGGSFGASPVVRRIAVDRSVSTLISSDSTFEGAVYAGAMALTALGDEGVAVHGSVDRGGPGPEEALLSADIDGDPELLAVVRQPLPGTDHTYNAISQVAGPDLANIVVHAFTDEGDVVDSVTSLGVTEIANAAVLVEHRDLLLVPDTLGLFRSAQVGRPVSAEGVPCMFMTDRDSAPSIVCG
ncbi:MAG: hypothetical protein AAGE52_35345, partial [Myxococcota bacterium]